MRKRLVLMRKPRLPPGAVGIWRACEMGRNLLKYSQQFDNAVWLKRRSTLTPNCAVAPDGTLTADKLCFDGTVGGSYIGQSVTITSTTATVSIFVKAAECTQVDLHFVSSTAEESLLKVNLLTGATISMTGSAAPTVTPERNGYYRISLSGAPGTPLYWCYLDLVGFKNIGDGVYVWGAQLRAGTEPGEYVPTTDKQTLPDSSGNGNHITIGSTTGVDTNDLAIDPEGVTAGGDDFATCTLSEKPAAGTILIVCKQGNATGPRYLFDSRVADDAGAFGYFADATGALVSATGTATYINGAAGSAATVGQWMTVTVANANLAMTNSILRFCRSYSGVFGDGISIADIRAYPYALAPAEVMWAHRALKTELRPYGVILP